MTRKKKGKGGGAYQNSDHLCWSCRWATASHCPWMGRSDRSELVRTRIVETLGYADADRRRKTVVVQQCLRYERGCLVEMEPQRRVFAGPVLGVASGG